jgi:hypothetical protein
MELPMPFRQVTLRGKTDIYELVCKSTKNSRVRLLGSEDSFPVPTSEITQDLTLETVILAIREHAQEHSHITGWDILLESWTDEMITIQVKNLQDPTAAIRKIARVLADQYQDEPSQDAILGTIYKS